ncbi:MAG: hypothetical protein M1812_004374 [Candelaria pacifica]|nr:MAG: hypothetical protein M1812_004374 [Candelaria pacifica]
MPAPPLIIPSKPPTPLPSSLRSDLNSLLLTSGGIDRIHSQLLSSLQTSGWTEAVRNFALEQFREGGKTTFEEVMEVVLREALRGEGEEGRGKGKGVESGRGGVEGGGREGLRVSRRVVDEGLEVVRRELEDVVEVSEG